MANHGAVGVVLGGYAVLPLAFTLPHLRAGGWPLRAAVLGEFDQALEQDPGAYRLIAGQVIHQGLPSVAVTLWSWGSRRLCARTETAPDGTWTLAVGPGEYGVTYHVTGYQPITHGPYRF